MSARWAHVHLPDGHTQLCVLCCTPSDDVLYRTADPRFVVCMSCAGAALDELSRLQWLDAALRDLWADPALTPPNCRCTRTDGRQL